MTRTALASMLRPLTAARARLVPEVRILMYHRVAPLAGYDQLNVQPERFERQMAHVAGTGRAVDLSTAVAALAAGTPAKPAIVVTFDDGYRDNLEHALPILQRYGIPATIFVTSAFCGQSMRHPRYAAEPGRLHLDWDEVRSLSRTAGITIGSHTMTHPFLSRMTDESAWREIEGSRREIENRLGMLVRHFCYPSGDVTPRERALVALAGYAAAVTVAPGGNRPGQDPHALRRTEVTDRDDVHELALKLDGAFDPLHRVLHWRRLRAFARARGDSRPSASGNP